MHVEIDIPRASTEPSPAKTKMKVAMNSDKAALMESGWVASSALPRAYLRGMVTRNSSVSPSRVLKPL